jgi:hypothetical protein
VPSSSSDAKLVGGGQVQMPQQSMPLKTQLPLQQSVLV